METIEKLSKLASEISISDDEMAKIRGGNLYFAFSTLSKLSEEHEGNGVVFSPVSLTYDLAMARVVSKDETLKQLDEAMQLVTGFEENDDMKETRIHKALSTTLKKLSANGPGLQLTIHNHIFSREGCPLLEDHAKSLSMMYRTSQSSVQFEKDTEGTCKALNEWMLQKEDFLYSNFVTANYFSESTVTVMLNYVQFNGVWEMTSYRMTDGYINVHDLQVMATRIFRSNVLGCEIVEMKYTGNRFSLLRFYPFRDTNIHQLLKRLTPDAFHILYEALFLYRRPLKLPPFILDVRMQVTSTNLLNCEIAGSNVVTQDVYMNFDHFGTHAYAATLLGHAPHEVIAEDMIFYNNNCIFVIYDKVVDTILFMGSQ